MADKPKRASEYKSEQVELVRATCLCVGTKLGDLMDDLVVIGGLVPSLLIDQDTLPEGSSAHVGTMDLDVGLTLALRNIEPDFAAIIAPGLRLAFQDRERVTIVGRTLFGEKATRDFWICGAGAYVVLKSLAFDGRGENKDAYDLYYVVRNFGSGVNEVADRLRPLVADAEAQRAIAILRRDFSDIESVGPLRVAEFVSGAPDDEIQSDVVGFIGQLLQHVKAQK